jgi:hypothetical protein
MEFSKYEKILRYGVKVEWYGVDVPVELLTVKIKLIGSNLANEIHLLEGTLSDLKGVMLEKRKYYIDALKNNLKNLPYSLNNDFYLKKKKRIEESIELEKKDNKTKSIKKSSKKK